MLSLKNGTKMLWFANLRDLFEADDAVTRIDAFGKIVVSVIAVMMITAAFSDVNFLSWIPEAASISLSAVLGFIIGATKIA